MFKKTLIAMSLAAVTGSAMADVAVSGRVEQTFTKTDSATAATDQWIGGTDNNIVFNVTEDLGNGLTAFAKVALDVDATDATGTAAHTHTVTNLTTEYSNFKLGCINKCCYNRAIRYDRWY